MLPHLSKTPRGESPPAPPLWLDFPLCFDRGGQTVANHRGQRREFGVNLLVFEGLVMQIPSWGSSRRDSKGSHVAPRGSQEVPRDPQRVPGSSQEAPGTSGEPKIMKNQWGFEGRSAETMQLSTIPRSRKPKTRTPHMQNQCFRGAIGEGALAQSAESMQLSSILKVLAAKTLKNQWFLKVFRPLTVPTVRWRGSAARPRLNFLRRKKWKFWSG